MRPERIIGQYKLELVVVPVTDVDRAKAFYSENCGFHVDVDHAVSDDFRVVQLTPTGSACSVSIGKGPSTATPGSVQGLQLVVADIDAAREELVGRGLDVAPVRHIEDGASRSHRRTTGLGPLHRFDPAS